MNQGRKKGRKKRMSAKLAVRNCREREQVKTIAIAAAARGNILLSNEWALTLQNGHIDFCSILQKKNWQINQQNKIHL